MTAKRDMSRRQDPRELARQRKNRQRAKLRRAGFVKLELSISSEVAAALSRAGESLVSSAKEEAEALLRHTASRHAQQAEALARRAGQLWQSAAPYLPYAAYLTKPGATFRIRDRELRQVDWQPLMEDLAKIHAVFRDRGWSRRRVEAFMRSAARKLT